MHCSVHVEGISFWFKVWPLASEGVVAAIAHHHTQEIKGNIATWGLDSATVDRLASISGTSGFWKLALVRSWERAECGEAQRPGPPGGN